MASARWVRLAGRAFSVLFALLLASRVASAPVTSGTVTSGSVTISGPGVSDHGQPNLVCFPTKATDVLLFFLSNYVAHAATVKTAPGAQTLEVMVGMLISLFFPVLGMSRAFEVILGWSWKLSPKFPFLQFEADTLQTALKAGALVVAVRNQMWKPAATDGMLRDLRRPTEDDYLLGDISHDVQTRAGERSEAQTPLAPGDDSVKASASSGRSGGFKCSVRTLPGYPENDPGWFMFGTPNVHGGFKLPKGYDWLRLPRNTRVLPYGRPLIESQPASGETAEVRLPTSFSVAQPIIAIFQTVSAGWTLYKASGDQIDQFGFAAFGLTVTPYLLMSIINFLAQLAVPQHSSVYIVYSEVLAEAAARVGNPNVTGIVGQLTPDTSASPEYLNGWVSEEGERGVNVELQSNPEPAEEDGERQESTSAAAGVEREASISQPKEKQVEEILVPSHPRFERHHPPRDAKWKKWLTDPELAGASAVVVSLLLACTPLAVNGSLSKFRPGQKSTAAQRGVIIAWIICTALSQLTMSGLLMILMLAFMVPYAIRYDLRGEGFPFDVDDLKRIAMRTYAGLLIVGSAIPLAMFVTVGQELMQYGNCQYIG